MGEVWGKTGVRGQASSWAVRPRGSAEPLGAAGSWLRNTELGEQAPAGLIHGGLPRGRPGLCLPAVALEGLQTFPREGLYSRSPQGSPVRCSLLSLSSQEWLT